MTRDELISKIKSLVKKIYREHSKKEEFDVEYDELTKFPELKNVIIDLLTVDYDKFLESIDWVAPRPTTFRINLLNGQNFLLIFTERSWIAQIEGKKYYLLNLNEEERAAESIARILQYVEVIEKEEDTEKDFEEESNEEPEEDTGEEIE